MSQNKMPSHEYDPIRDEIGDLGNERLVNKMVDETIRKFKPQSQASLRDQLIKLFKVTNLADLADREGLYDAADYVREYVKDDQTESPQNDPDPDTCYVPVGGGLYCGAPTGECEHTRRLSNLP